MSSEVPVAGYAQAVTRAASDIAAEIRRRVPGVGVKKLHKLLYYCQAHHLAALGRPLYRESISAWDMGPVVGRLWKAEKDGELPPGSTDLVEAELNTIGYVLSRYGRLSARDLEHMTHAESPWQKADEHRRAGGSVTIERDWIVEYFRSDDESGEDVPQLDRALVAEFLRDAARRKEQYATKDTVGGLLERVGQAG